MILSISKRSGPEKLSIRQSWLFVLSIFCTRSQRPTVLSLKGFSEGIFPATYLGVPIASGRLKVIHFDVLVTR